MAQDDEQLVLSISADTRQILNAIKRLEGDVGRSTRGIEKQFEGLGRTVDKSVTTAMQTRIDAMVGIGTKATKEWTGALADQGKELERIRSKFNPIFSTISKYKTSVTDIQTAHRMGAISADEMTAAIQRERQAALSSIAALKQRNSVLSETPKGGNNQFNTANIAAQFQDIGVTTAMGMSPIQIALQQGTQLSTVLNSMGSARGAIAGLGAAFMQIINPISLVTIGVIAAGAAAVQYFTNSGDASKTLDDILATHEKNIRKLGPAYEEARKKAKEYATDPSVVNALFSDDVKKAGDKLKAEIGKTLQSIQAELLIFATKNNGSILGNRFAPADAIINSLRAGKIEIADFLKQVTALQNAGKLSPEAAQSLREYAAGADDAARALFGMQGVADPVALSIASLQKALDRINAGPVREELARLKKEVEDGRMTVDQLKRALDVLSGARPDMSGAISEFGSLADAAIKARNAIGQVSLAQGLAGQFSKDAAVKGGRLSPLSEDEKKAVMDRQQQIFRQQLEFYKRTGEIEKAFGISNKKLPKEKKAPVDRDGNAYRDLVKSAKDRIEQLRLEEQLVGKTGVAADAYRMKLELLQKATDKGRKLSPEHRAELEKLAETYGKVAEKVVGLRLQEDLLFERQQMFRSPTEQRVFDQLRSAGIDPSSAQGEWLAGQIRLNEQLAVGRDLAMDFASSFVADLRDGVSAMDALANAAKRLGDKLLDMALNEAINGLFKNLIGGGGGMPGLFGLGGKATDYFPAAPAAPGGLFFDGGFTGPGGKHQPAGVVHKGEYVFDQEAVKRIGIDNLRLLQRGYADGGFVGTPQMPRIQSPANRNSGASFSFAPVIDARGADVAAVDRLQKVVAKQQMEFESRVKMIVKGRPNGRW